MAFERITDEDIKKHGVQAAPDMLTGTAQENKCVFDRLVQEIVKPVVNDMLGDVEAELDKFGEKEQAWAEAEDGRVTAESNRESAEAERVTAEGNRESAEAGRVTAEGERESAETDRETAEGVRASAETARETAEGNRVTAENKRFEYESERMMAELRRAHAEAARERDEAARETAEGARASAEGERVTAEAGRVTADQTRENRERIRVQNEALRYEAEESRATAEESRATAEESRVTAEESREAAEAARAVFEEYDPTKQYVPGNKVAYEGNSYLCIFYNAGFAPPNDRYWLLIAAKGADGKGTPAMQPLTFTGAVTATYDGTEAVVVPIPDIRKELQEVQRKSWRPMQSGSVLSCHDCAGGNITDLQLIGNSVQDGTPTPTAPVAVNSVAGNVNLVACGKNIFNISTANVSSCILNGEEARSNIENTYFARLAASRLPTVETGVSYVFSVDDAHGRNLTFVIYGDRTDGKTFQTESSNSGENKVAITPENFEKITTIYFYFNRQSAPFTDTKTIFTGFQVEMGKTATAYEAYRGMDVSIPLTDADGVSYELRRVGDVADRVTRGADGRYKIQQRVGKYIFTGDETIGAPSSPTEGNNQFSVSCLSGALSVPDNANGLFSHGAYEFSSTPIVPSAYTNAGDAVLLLPKTDFPDGASVTAWLKAQASAGTPVTVYYRLDRWVEVELCDDAQAAIESIELPRGTANLYCYDEVRPDIGAQYAVDVLYHIEAIEAQMQPEVAMLEAGGAEKSAEESEAVANAD